MAFSFKSDINQLNKVSEMKGVRFRRRERERENQFYHVQPITAK